MRSPDRTDVERIEGLLRGMPPETEREAHIEGLVRELRASAPPAPASLRERVRSLREREPERSTSGWRPLLVVAPVVLALVAGAAVLDRGTDGGGSDGAVALEQREATPEAVAPTIAQDATGSSRALAPGGRAQEWDVTLQLAVRDNARLSDASAEAIATTRELGGFVVSSNVATQGRSGRAHLVVRVPQRRVQDAIARFSELGTITGQQVSVQDRQGDLDRLARQIDGLRVQIAQLNVRLRTERLGQAERLRLELRRERLQSTLNGLTRERRAVSSEVALAEVSLSLETRKAAAAAGEGRFDRAAGDALEVLGVAGAVALFLAIVLAPLAVLVLLAVLARRSLRRRDEERLLDRPQPTTR